MCTGCERRDGSRGGFLPIASQKGLEERRERVKPGEEESGTHVPPDCAAARGPFCDPECEVRPPARLPGRLGRRGRPGLDVISAWEERESGGRAAGRPRTMVPRTLGPHTPCENAHVAPPPFLLAFYSTVVYIQFLLFTASVSPVTKSP